MVGKTYNKKIIRQDKSFRKKSIAFFYGRRIFSFIPTTKIGFKREPLKAKRNFRFLFSQETMMRLYFYIFISSHIIYFKMRLFLDGLFYENFVILCQHCHIFSFTHFKAAKNIYQGHTLFSHARCY